MLKLTCEVKFMPTTFEQVIEAVNHLSAEEIHQLGELVREKETQNSEKAEKKSKNQGRNQKI